MKISPKQIASTTVLVLCIFAGCGMLGEQPSPSNTPSAATVLNREQASAILPPSVFFRGQTASIQARNSAGLRSATGKFVLATLVDTSGYSSAVQERYQAYLFAEVPLNIDGQRLPPGAYGFGFISGDRIVIMDLGGNEVLHGTTRRDAALSRPTPLQIIMDTRDGPRLYLGRNYVVLSLLEK